jgi:uncharacterized protein YyaL (SSP411 family)
MKLMTNRLANSASPYLLQHAENPVNWYPWGDEAIELAKQENQPILLSIGYSACHWCHVMAHESFENVNTASLMNQNFINIKVDREERPDLDSVYMQAVISMTGQGGWPLTVFLTPDLAPFFGGTYFPPVQRNNLPSFSQVLNSIINAWQNRQQDIVESTKEITRQLLTRYPPAGDRQLGVEHLKNAEKLLIEEYDWDHGGWGKAPKFPLPLPLDFLLRRAVTNRLSDEEKRILQLVSHSLRSMALGGIYDLIGGGFSRYSTDDTWLTPHFEKMLYDNALLAQVYLHAYLASSDTNFLKICSDTLDFVREELTHPDGGFYSSLDADSEGVEGKYYLWSLREIKETIIDPEDLNLFLSVFPITEQGNFTGKNILQQTSHLSVLADKYDLPITVLEHKITKMLQALKLARMHRVKPAVDDKVILAWNGLACISFFEAYKYLKIKRFGEMAIRNLEFLIANLMDNDALYRSWRAGSTSSHAFLEDYAAMILALLAGYQTSFDNRYFALASSLTETMLNEFSDPNSGFFDSGQYHKTPLFQPKDLHDNVTPSGNALAATALIKMAAFTGNNNWYELAWQTLKLVADFAPRNPLGYSYWLCAIDLASSGVQEVAIIQKDDEVSKFLDLLNATLRPNTIVALSPLPIRANAPPLLSDRPLINNQNTVYVCRNFVCKHPVTSIDEFQQLLGEKNTL